MKKKIVIPKPKYPGWGNFPTEFPSNKKEECECSRGEVSSFDCLTHKSWHVEAEKKYPRRKK